MDRQCYFLAFGAVGAGGRALKSSALATNPRRAAGRDHPSFSALAAIFSVAAFAASNVAWPSVMPRWLFLLASVVIT